MEICQKRREKIRAQEARLEHPRSSRRDGLGKEILKKLLFFLSVGVVALFAFLPLRDILKPKIGAWLITWVVIVVLGFCCQYVVSILDGDHHYFHPYSAWKVAIVVLLLTLLDARLQGWIASRLLDLNGLRSPGARLVFLVPNILVPLLLGLVYDSRTALGLGLVTTFALSIGEAARAVAPPEDKGLIVICVFLASLCSVCLASREAPRLSNRRQLFHLTARIALLQTPLAILVAARLNRGDPAAYAVAIVVSLLVLYCELALSSIVAVDILRQPIEKLTRRVSSFTLMRYADLDNPLLRRLAREAPGTYHHSITVGDLVHNAALAVGANALLARTGAYYHDIGKLEHPFYFTENQSGLDNPHDALPPDISRILIMNHVKAGLVIAKCHHFPEVLRRFVETHHGTTVLVWFQNKALERLARLGQTGKNGAAVTAFYRYPGPLPVSREESILMLADSVEAASRSLKVYDCPAIERLVREIVKAKWLDGQLDKSKLTNAERAIVVTSFIKTLVPLLHGRLPYPPQRK